MTKLLLVLTAVAALIAAVFVPRTALAAVEDLPGMDTAANMKEWLKLSDDQVAKLRPVIATRIQKLDAALTKLEAAGQPDVAGFLEENGKAKKEFNGSIQKILNKDQMKKWEQFKVELEKDIVNDSAKNQLAELQPALKLTDDQVKKLMPSFVSATQKKVDLMQKLGDGSKITMAEKIKAKKSMEGIDAQLDKSVSEVVSPEQLTAYKAAKAK